MKTKEFPILKEEIKFRFKSIQKRIDAMKFSLDVHFGHTTSEETDEVFKLITDIITDNIKTASKILEEVMGKKESKYITHDLDELTRALSLLLTVELTLSRYVNEIYKGL